VAPAAGCGCGCCCWCCFTAQQQQSFAVIPPAAQLKEVLAVLHPLQSQVTPLLLLLMLLLLVQV
jgi:hypothetical protein